jgi:hypothetical protein
MQAGALHGCHGRAVLRRQQPEAVHGVRTSVVSSGSENAESIEQTSKCFQMNLQRAPSCRRLRRHTSRPDELRHRSALLAFTGAYPL